MFRPAGSSTTVTVASTMLLPCTMMSAGLPLSAPTPSSIVIGSIESMRSIDGSASTGMASGTAASIVLPLGRSLTS
jgi:hypothetical protein